MRQFEAEDGLADLDAAIQLASDATAPYIFRASGRARSGDAPGAVADLAAFYENGPDDDEAQLAEQFSVSIVDAALDACIDGDVNGTMAVADVLQCYTDILEVDEGNAAASVYLGWLIARSGVDDEMARQRLDEGLAVDPTISAGYVFRAALRAHLGDVEGARADLDAFAATDAPAAQQVAADQVRAAIDAGEDPLPARSTG